MKILVTGGCGFIGSNFIRLMLKAYPNYHITNLDALNYSANLANLSDVASLPNYSFVHASINDYDCVKNELSKGYDAIINFAAESHVDNSISNPTIFMQTNALGILNLLQCAKELAIKRFIQISTDEVYGSLGAEGYFTENSPIAPNSPYSASKASGDLISRAYYETYGLPVIITRCSNNYGPYQYPEKLIPLFIYRLLNNQKVGLYGDGGNVRDWLFVEDHCWAIDKVLHHGQIGEVYNIGGHNEKSNIEITRLLLKYLDKDESYIDFITDRLGHDRRYAIDNTKISTQLNWQPTVSFEEGILSTIKWYVANQEWLKNLLNR